MSHKIRISCALISHDCRLCFIYGCLYAHSYRSIQLPLQLKTLVLFGIGSTGSQSPWPFTVAAKTPHFPKTEVKLKIFGLQGLTRTCQHHAYIFSFGWHHTGSRAQCSVYCISLYGHGVCMSLFGRESPNIPSFSSFFGEWVGALSHKHADAWRHLRCVLFTPFPYFGPPGGRAPEEGADFYRRANSFL